MFLLLKPVLLVFLSRSRLSWLCNAGTSAPGGSHVDLLPAPGRAFPVGMGWPVPSLWGGVWPLRACPALGPCTAPTATRCNCWFSVVFQFKGSEIIKRPHQGPERCLLIAMGAKGFLP